SGICDEAKENESFVSVIAGAGIALVPGAVLTRLRAMPQRGHLPGRDEVTSGCMGQEYRKVLRAAFCRPWAPVTETLCKGANAPINPKANTMVNTFMGFSRTVSFGSASSSISANPPSGRNELFLFQVNFIDVLYHCSDAS